MIEINPNFSEVYPLLARVLLQANDVAGAVDVYRAYVRRFPNWYEGYDGLILALIRQGANGEAVRVYHEAVLHADPRWPENGRRRMNYNAACAAALAGAGSGRDAPALPDQSAFRERAHQLLKDEFATYNKAFESNPSSARAATHKAMNHWLTDSDLAPYRHTIAVGLLPVAERDAWKQLWADVRRLQAATSPSAVPKE